MTMVMELNVLYYLMHGQLVNMPKHNLKHQPLIDYHLFDMQDVSNVSLIDWMMLTMNYE